MIIRPIKSSDNLIVASIIRDILTEFGANRAGFAWQDPEIDRMSLAYTKPGCGYWVIESAGLVLGGGGIARFACDLKSCCELQKMYLLPQARGNGWGEALIDTLLEEVKSLGYQHCYLETLSSMIQAVSLYQKKGFKQLTKPLGNSGHNACDEWYLK